MGSVEEGYGCAWAGLGGLRAAVRPDRPAPIMIMSEGAGGVGVGELVAMVR